MVANNDAGVFHNLLLPARVPIVNPQARALLRGYATRCGAAHALPLRRLGPPAAVPSAATSLRFQATPRPPDHSRRQMFTGILVPWDRGTEAPAKRSVSV